LDTSCEVLRQVIRGNTLPRQDWYFNVRLRDTQHVLGIRRQVAVSSQRPYEDGTVPIAEVDSDQLARILQGECPSVVIGDIVVWDFGA